MKLLIFDCETTGLPLSRWSRLQDTCDWPYIVQLSWIVYDASQNKLEKVVDKVVHLPPGLGICKESSKIHGITTKKMLAEGVDIKSLLEEFVMDVKRCKMMIAHNIDFDRNVIMVEQIRNKMPEKDLLKSLRKKEYCTMKESTTLCNIVIKNPYTGQKEKKFPKLSELHNYQFGTVPSGLHNSMIDILVCFRCFGMLYWNVDILTRNQEIAILYSKFC